MTKRLRIALSPAHDLQPRRPKRLRGDALRRAVGGQDPQPYPGPVQLGGTTSGPLWSEDFDGTRAS